MFMKRGNQTKQLIIVLLASIALASGSALAADMPVKAPPLAPAVVEPWTGFYIGGNAGFGWMAGQVSDQEAPIANAASVGASLSTSGFVGGGQAGYLKQLTPNFVVGLEADLVGFDHAASGAAPNLFPDGTPLPGGVSFSTKVDWLSSYRGRIGYLVTPSLLAYGTGGFAIGNVQYSGIHVYANPLGCPNCAIVSPFTSSGTGYAVGGGLEYLLGRNWLLRGEYVYYNLGGASAAANQVGIPNEATFVWGRVSLQAVRAALSYKF